MKNFFIVCLTVLAVSCSQDKKSYVIQGSAPAEYNEHWVYLYDYNQNANLDSVLVVDGKFSLAGMPDTTYFARLDLDRKLYANLILEGGTILVDLSDPSKISGTPLNDNLAEYMAGMNELSGSYREGLKRIEEEYQADKEAHKKATETLRDSIVSEYKAFNQTYFYGNTGNAIGAYVFLDWVNELSIEEFDTVYNALNETVRAKKNIQKLKEINEKKALTAEGKMFTDFTVENGNVDGSSVSFSDYIGKGKYVLVDFWASWCGPCIAETPVIAEVYKKYKGNKFDVLGIAVWDKREATLKGIKEHKIVWPQIIDAQQIPTEIYGIRGIPQIILFGPDGTILARNLRGDALKAKIAEVLK